MTARFRPFKPALGALALAAVAALSACAPTNTPPLPMIGGRAIVIGPDPDLDATRVADPWWVAPPGGANRFVPVDLEGRPVLRIDAAAPGQPSTTLLGRRVAVPLMSMPYLHWAWYLEPALFEGRTMDGLDRGLKISVGFYGGAPSSPQITDRWFGGPDGMPAFDRRIDLMFGGLPQPSGELATQHLAAVTDQGVRHELRAPRSGDAGAWKLEAIDISRLYAMFWPNDRIDRTQIVFVAVGGLPGRVPASTPALPLGYAAEISLTR